MHENSFFHIVDTLILSGTKIKNRDKKNFKIKKEEKTIKKRKRKKKRD